MADEFDYVVIGSGAGGGPVAANLATAGFSVLVLEAGKPYFGENYAVPALHGQSTQDPEMRWDFWVRHYKDQKAQERDSKYYRFYPPNDPTKPDDGVRREEVNGVLYPRASTLGGCTAHNAMILVYPHESDWKRLQDVTGDASWAPENMRRYFERVERCQYLASPSADSRHGTKGWLASSVADLSLVLNDPQLLAIILGAAVETHFDIVADQGFSLETLREWLALKGAFQELRRLKSEAAGDVEKRAKLLQLILTLLDINDAGRARGKREGVYLIPLSVNNGVRNGSRERLLQAERASEGRLKIRTGCFVRRITFDGKRATGVEYVEGDRLYRASPEPDGGRDQPTETITVTARKEVIVGCGAFNTPQLLMLSGIGPKDELNRLKIEPVVNDTFWNGVGRNLHDRYEVAIISELKDDFTIVADCRFAAPVGGAEPDSCLRQWRETKSGVYATNGAAVAIVRRSTPDLADPDLFIFALPAFFKGYFPEYDEKLGEARNHFTWAILKGHTENRAGRVTLNSTDPFERPVINFHYFKEGTDEGKKDLEALVEGVKFVRDIMDKPGLAEKVVNKAVQPQVSIDTDREIAEWIQAEAWGHHACGTCRIGREGDPDAVLDGDFRIRGLEGIRVVDASVFPHIPGFFIVSAIYMIAEKASEAILKDAGKPLPDVQWQELPADYWHGPA